MGIPVLTLSGETPTRSDGASVLGAIGLNEFIAEDKEDFVRKGVYWASNVSKLSEMRMQMRVSIVESGAGKADLVAQSLGSALRIMWKRWCKRLPVEAFTI